MKANPNMRNSELACCSPRNSDAEICNIFNAAHLPSSKQGGSTEPLFQSYIEKKYGRS